MSEQDNRNEVFISKRKVDSTSGYIIEQTDVCLKSKDESIETLLLRSESILLKSEIESRKETLEKLSKA